MSGPCRSLVAVLALTMGTVTAAAEPGPDVEPIEEIEVRSPPSEPAAAAAQVTVVRVDERLPGSADVATAVARAPGTTVSRLGGVGAQSSVGIRGSTSRQVEVLLDGIPLNPEGGAAVDLSELPLRAFERVEVYRGAAPAELGSVALGGVVSLVTGPGHTVGSLGGGSFGSARATLATGGETPVGHLWVAVDGLATDGGFRYLDDGGTQLTDTDDSVQIRTNNDARQASAHARWRRGGERVQMTVLNALVTKDQGVAGFTSAPTSDVRYRVLRDLLAVQAEGASGASRWRARGWGMVRAEALDDPVGELGVGGGELRRDQVGMAGVHGWAASAVSRAVRLDATADLRAEDARSAGAASGAAAHARRVARATTSATLGPVGGAWQVTPTFAALVLDDRGQAASEQSGLVLPRVAAVARGGPVVVKSTAGLFTRPPDLVELFGDRGTLVGNPELRPERAAQVDAGASVHHGAGRLEVVGFHRVVRDLVTLQQTAQGVARPENVDRATVTGVELAAGLEGPGAWWGLNGTLQRALDTSDDPAYAGNQLPRVPIADVGTRAGVELGQVGVGWDFTWTAGTWLDRANFFRQAPRPLHGATVSVRDTTSVWWLELDVRNLADRFSQPVPADPLIPEQGSVLRPLEDFVGYPLPGRSVWVTVRWTP